MPDILVKVFDMEAPCNNNLKENGITIRKCMPPEKHVVVEWVREKFGNGWASECDVAFSNNPVSCFIAIKDNKILGFACYEATFKNYFGPTGVDESQRGKGIGKALLLNSMYALKEMGYNYGIIGGAGPVEFYQKTFPDSIVIPNSTPGPYTGLLS